MGPLVRRAAADVRRRICRQSARDVPRDHFSVSESMCDRVRALATTAVLVPVPIRRRAVGSHYAWRRSRVGCATVAPRDDP